MKPRSWTLDRKHYEIHILPLHFQEADAILLSREFASYEVPMHLYHKMSLVQSYIAAKCRQVIAAE